MAITRELRCKLTDEERKAKADALAATISEHKRVDADRANTQSTARARLKELREQINELTRDYQEGTELRSVDCVEERVGTRIQLRRTDTGIVIESRKMTKEERQGALPGIEDGEGKASKPPARKRGRKKAEASAEA